MSCRFHGSQTQKQSIVPTFMFATIWGGGTTIGLGGTASNTITVDDVFVPAHLAVLYDWKDFDMPREGTIGFQLHSNPLYLARAMTFFYASLNATQIGNARAALQEVAEEVLHAPADGSRGHLG